MSKHSQSKSQQSSTSDGLWRVLQYVCSEPPRPRSANGAVLTGDAELYDAPHLSLALTTLVIIERVNQLYGLEYHWDFNDDSLSAFVDSLRFYLRMATCSRSANNVYSPLLINMMTISAEQLDMVLDRQFTFILLIEHATNTGMGVPRVNTLLERNFRKAKTWCILSCNPHDVIPMTYTFQRQIDEAGVTVLANRSRHLEAETLASYGLQILDMVYFGASMVSTISGQT